MGQIKSKFQKKTIISYMYRDILIIMDGYMFFSLNAFLSKGWMNKSEWMPLSQLNMVYECHCQSTLLWMILTNHCIICICISMIQHKKMKIILQRLLCANTILLHAAFPLKRWMNFGAWMAFFWYWHILYHWILCCVFVWFKNFKNQR